ncbi:XRE family transcriptional regulator [Paenibacillus dendritiformis]|uniref:XRE family transcriptional regulator n=1 Tax=Paenibacillus dendritiformis TaxID=130049 RepID=UPI000DA79A7A|nr:XRE family transcriptional regulator [Paenibacillus dendritiformis]PZM65686.1 XRE family transcriptional regulator [Paenibacillus dendritiformis]
MARKRPVTAFGWEIKRRLAEMQMDQREFCRKYNIPENRLGDLITGARKATRYRQQVERLLGIEYPPEQQAK